MAGFLKKAQIYLGLGPDDEYDDYDDPEDVPPPPREARDARDVGPTRTSSTLRSASVTTTRPSARPVPAGARAGREPIRVRHGTDGADGVGEGSVVRTLPKERTMESAPPPPSTRTPVRSVTSRHARPVVVSPSTFNSAQEVADKFKASQPVIVNLQGVDKDLSRRLLDFCSGICYALSGHMERVASRVYLLTPADVEVSAEDRRRLAERGLAG